MDLDLFKPNRPNASDVVGEKQLYYAPEILRNYVTSDADHTALRRCDIYSFAILTQEILYRRGPFYVLDESITIERKIDAVTREQETPFRPFLGHNDDVKNSNNK